jgi:hypothetical protein
MQQNNDCFSNVKKVWMRNHILAHESDKTLTSFII